MNTDLFTAEMSGKFTTVTYTATHLVKLVELYLISSYNTAVNMLKSLSLLREPLKITSLKKVITALLCHLPYVPA